MKNEKKVPVFLVRDLQKEISQVYGMQNYLRKFYAVHARNFNQENVHHVDLERVCKMLTGMAYKLEKQKFMDIWMRLGQHFQAMVNDHSDITDGTGV